MVNKDYYQILGLNRNASAEEIKRAFHKLAHKYHPDKKGGDEAKFKEVNEAYQILIDEKKRQQYDHIGGDFAGNWDFGNFTQSDSGGFQFDLGDLFGDLFGTRGGAGSGHGTRKRRGRDISVDIQISFAESVFGTERQVLINKISACQLCGGDGAKPGTKTKTCSACNGKGRLHDTRRSFLGVFTVARECSACGGDGQVPETACAACGGAGVVSRAEEIKIAVPPGVDNGEMIRLAGQGEAVSRGVPGDLYVRLRVEKHRTIKRDGSDLRQDLEVKLTDALLGAEYQVETLDGPLLVKIPAGVTAGEILRLRERGVPYRTGKRGDFLLTIKIKMPGRLSRRAKELIEELKKDGI